MLILQWNVSGYRLRYPDLMKLISETSPACICLQETILGLTNPKLPTGYTLIKGADPISTSGNGLAVLIDHKYSYNLMNLNTGISSLCVQIFLERLITICNVYISPNTDLHALESLMDQLPEPYIC